MNIWKYQDRATTDTYCILKNFNKYHRFETGRSNIAGLRFSYDFQYKVSKNYPVWVLYQYENY